MAIITGFIWVERVPVWPWDAINRRATSVLYISWPDVRLPQLSPVLDTHCYFACHDTTALPRASPGGRREAKQLPFCRAHKDKQPALVGLGPRGLVPLQNVLSDAVCHSVFVDPWPYQPCLLYPERLGSILNTRLPSLHFQALGLVAIPSYLLDPMTTEASVHNVTDLRPTVQQTTTNSHAPLSPAPPPPNSIFPSVPIPTPPVPLGGRTTPTQTYQQWEEDTVRVYLSHQPEPSGPDSAEKIEELKKWAAVYKLRIAKISNCSGPIPKRLIDALAEAKWKRMMILFRLFEWYKLPTEIILDIFRHVVWSTNSATQCNLGLLRLTWVCRKWRELILSDRILWSTIWFAESMPWSRSLAFLERAGTTPLQLRIGESSRFLNTRDPKLVITTDQMLWLLDRILTKTDQIFMLIISVEEWPVALAALDRLRTVSRAPLLTRFEIHRLGRPYVLHGEESQSFRTTKASSLFSGQAPLLKRVCCNGVHLDWDKPSFSNLLHLDLRRLPAQYSPSIEQFYHVLEESPSLKALLLDGGGPAWDDANPRPDRAPVSVPNLVTLSLGSFSLLFAIFLVQSIEAPGLRDLTLMDMNVTDYSPLLQALTGRFPDVITLTLFEFTTAFARHSERKLVRWLMSMPHVQYLRIGGLRSHVLRAFGLDGRLYVPDVFPTRADIQGQPIFLLPELRFLEYQMMEACDIVNYSRFRTAIHTPLEMTYVNWKWYTQVSAVDPQLPVLRTIRPFTVLPPNAWSPDALIRQGQIWGKVEHRITWCHGARGRDGTRRVCLVVCLQNANCLRVNLKLIFVCILFLLAHTSTLRPSEDACINIIMFSFHRPLSRASTETTATLDDNFSTSDDASSEVPYARRRATDTQIQALHGMFETNPYPTREERNNLAEEIGMEYKAVTVWFQNRRQSAKRKAWTQNSRARKRAEARQLAVPEDTTPTAKSMMSLDHIASLSERPSGHTPLTSAPGPFLTPRKANNHACPTTPLSNFELWRHMPSSPPEDPASPGIDKLRLSVLPAQANSAKSLEWACAKDRVSRRQLKKEGRGKENRPPKSSPATRRQTRKARGNSSSNDGETARRDADRASAEEYAFAARGGRPGGSPTPFSVVNMPPENVAADVEAAMLLLDFAVVKDPKRKYL
ncbi:hypothetical protein EVG20_g2455 [Dentipellis fragilis]|uniref:Homeobox domain-containing protein n=1 Tax=Dentipellis fragilis TaxID=205917 RepID=A0A4Y9Z7Q3_9AGAM|nr:hypothetical protein EVG20_g2455 [Dentipellis fragilis]